MRLITFYLLFQLLSNYHDNPACNIPLYLSTEKNIITIEISTRRLNICHNGIIVKEFPVSIGKNGIDKKRTGDNKTPLGLYRVQKPRPSERFMLFIPIDYPSLEQIMKGFSGDSIGIHGPKRKSKNLHIIDWTKGCIATGKDKDIIELIEWIKELRINYVLIR